MEEIIRTIKELLAQAEKRAGNYNDNALIKPSTPSDENFVSVNHANEHNGTIIAKRSYYEGMAEAYEKVLTLLM